ncbi:MAG: chemotaxis protein CheW [Candidatus Nitrosotenuis sp.]
MSATTQIIQVVVFSLTDPATKRNEEYGVGVEQVQEIRTLESMTRLPNAPIHVRGVTNLRGKIISIIDIKQKLGFPASEIDNNSRVLIAEINSKQIGLLVDQVDQVMRISTNDIDLQSDTAGFTQYMKGIAKIQDRLIIILDLQKLLEDINNNHFGE